MSALAAVTFMNLVILLANIGILALVMKLYTEILKIRELTK